MLTFNRTRIDNRARKLYRRYMRSQENTLNRLEKLLVYRMIRRGVAETIERE